MKFPNGRQAPEGARPTLKPMSFSGWVFAAATVFVIIAIGVTIWLLTIASHAKPGTDQANARLDAVRTGLAAGAGAGAAVGLVLALRRQHHQEIATAWTDQDATERRITELYAKAVEQLGSDRAPVRLGGLYALERLAQDNDLHRQTIVNVVCAYLRMPFSPTPPASKPEPEVTEDQGKRDAGTDGNGDTWLQEREVRLTAQRILGEHLRDVRDEDQRSTDPPDSRFWPNIRVNLAEATLFDINLQSGVLADSDFRGATFIGDFVFNTTTFIADARFDGATFTGDVSFLETTFTADAGFGGATFTGQTSFVEATFGGKARFHGATFSGDARFHAATFTDRAEFGDATFSGGAEFWRATFNGIAEFTGAAFDGIAQFHGAAFNGFASFQATFRGTAEFVATSFKRAVKFNEATFSRAAAFKWAAFHLNAMFSCAVFNEAVFDDATFSQEAWFDQVTFNGIAWFTRTTFTGRATFDKATFSSKAHFKQSQVLLPDAQHVWPTGWRLRPDGNGRSTVGRARSIGHS